MPFCTTSICAPVEHITLIPRLGWNHKAICQRSPRMVVAKGECIYHDAATKKNAEMTHKERSPVYLRGGSQQASLSSPLGSRRHYAGRSARAATKRCRRLSSSRGSLSTPSLTTIATTPHCSHKQPVRRRSTYTRPITRRGVLYYITADWRVTCELTAQTAPPAGNSHRRPGAPSLTRLHLTDRSAAKKKNEHPIDVAKKKNETNSKG